MEREQAKALAETTSTAQIKEMLNNALNSIIDWHRPSAANPGINISSALTIFFGALNDVEELDEISKTNMIHCFGDYLPLKMEDILDYDDSLPDDLPW